MPKKLPLPKKRDRDRRAAKCRKDWPDPDAHTVQDPGEMLSLAMFLQMRDDLTALPPALAQAVEARDEAAQAIARFHDALTHAQALARAGCDAVDGYVDSPEPRELPFEFVCDYTGLTTEEAVAKLLEPLGPNLVAFIQKTPGAECPLCQATLPPA